MYNALTTTLRSSATADTHFATAYRTLSGRELRDDAEEVARAVMAELRHMIATDDALDPYESQRLQALEHEHLRTNVHQEDTMTMTDDYAPVDPYAAGIAKLKAAAVTTESAFEDRWKARRAHELAIEHAEIDASIAAASGPRLTAAELAEIPDPPDPYAAGIKALQLKEAR